MLLSLLAQAGSDGYMPHGMCYLWQEDLVWIHVISDALTSLAYWAIPPFLVYLAVRARREIPSTASYAPRRLPYDWMLVAFGVFIVACGATHAMGIWTIWEPRYWLEGGVKAVTAMASIATAIALPPLVPRVLTLIQEARESELRRVELEEAQEEQRELVQRLKAANESKDRFLANVSHDLRTPLSLVLGPVEELLEREQPPEAREALETVARNARTLRSQVEDLLSVASAENGELDADIRQIDLASLIREIAGHYEGQARRRGIEYRVEAPESLAWEADPNLLKRAVLNLLSNAVKFTPEGGEVELRLTRGENRTAEILVEDTGPGIPEGEREDVFLRFRQGAAAAGHPEGGTGLGLAIVREVAEAHGGSVALDSAPGGGARFTLRLPGAVDSPTLSAGPEVRPRDHADRPAAPGPTHPAHEPGSGSEAWLAPESTDRATILVVEDSADMARHLGEFLSKDYQVAFAADGEEGLAVALEIGPDLVLTDIMMPGMGGDQLVRELRTRRSFEQVPILVLTARAEESLPERMLRAGAQDFLVKPVRKEELLARVENLLEMSGSRRVLQETLDSDETSLKGLARLAARRKRELEGAVQKNEVLLRELHHRVKGNLQTISSLLSLQLRKVQDREARRSLEESRGRVATMGLLHTELYASGVHDRVDLGNYLGRLVEKVVRSRDRLPAVETVLAMEAIESRVDEAVTCGLLLHELVANALQHAFSSGDSGTVRVSLRREGEDAVLVVEDDGRGLEVPGEDEAGSLGLELVDALVKQLDGRFRISVEDGTRIEVVFPLPAPSDEDVAVDLSGSG